MRKNRTDLIKGLQRLQVKEFSGTENKKIVFNIPEKLEKSEKNQDHKTLLLKHTEVEPNGVQQTDNKINKIRTSVEG
jgi:hypothetical protein